jgi:hypothetical protein
VLTFNMRSYFPHCACIISQVRRFDILPSLPPHSPTPSRNRFLSLVGPPSISSSLYYCLFHIVYIYSEKLFEVKMFRASIRAYGEK